MVRIASTIKKAGATLRLQLGRLASESINLESFRIHRCLSQSDSQENNSKLSHPFERRVLMDLQILDAYATLAEFARKSKR